MSPLLFALLAACDGTPDDTAVTTETVDIEGILWDDAGSCWEPAVWERPLAFWPIYDSIITQGCGDLDDTGPPWYYPVGTIDGGCALFAEESICVPWDDPYFTACEDVPGCCEHGRIQAPTFCPFQSETLP